MSRVQVLSLRPKLAVLTARKPQSRDALRLYHFISNKQCKRRKPVNCLRRFFAKNNSCNYVNKDKSIIEFSSEECIDHLRNELINLACKKHLGNYSFCKVTQIIIFSKEQSINYFTNIDFSERHKKIPFEFLSPKPISITEKYKLAICQYSLTISDFLDLYIEAHKTGEWKYNNQVVIIDGFFYSDKKFVPENDPSGAQYDTFVPIEEALYGSNFSGNYYIHELFSDKRTISTILSEKEILKIQSEIKKCRLGFNLARLTDRIGNIICKFNVESLIGRPKALNTRGIKFEFSISPQIKKHKLCSHIYQEHDKTIYKNIINTQYDGSPIAVPVNQAKTCISITDSTTGLTLFYGVFDYTTYSNYYLQLSPPFFSAQTPSTRILHHESGDEIITLTRLEPLGPICSFTDLQLASDRAQTYYDNRFFDRGYMKVYRNQEHTTALQNIVEIINSNLIWDLQEVWIIDPYLSATDIVNTALKCSKENIVIKALCAYSSIHGDKETKDLLSATDFELYKRTQSNKLSNVLGPITDIKVEYRSVIAPHGTLFHDRYIMLKYGTNRSRVWSLGASINSIGTNHSIIQIVEAPNKLLALFEDLWNQTNCTECLIYKR